MNTTFDYAATKRHLLDGASRIGRSVSPGALPDMSLSQRKRLGARNMIADERWQLRLLADGSLLVEIAYGWFIDRPVFGLTVFCVRDLAGDAEEWDHALSNAYGSVSEVLGRLAELNSGGRDRIAALAAASS